MDTKTPGFLRLPTEIRYKIFSLLVPLRRSFYFERMIQEPKNGQVRRLRTFDQNRNFVSPAGVASLMLINQAISSEVLDLLYGCNTFAFFDAWVIEIFIVRIGPTNLRRIRHVKAQARSLNVPYNKASTNTLFSIISNNFSNLETLRIVGLGRGSKRQGSYDPLLWPRKHLERLTFVTSLSGVLRNARVYCDQKKRNSRLLCNNAEYRADLDEVEVDMDNERQKAKKYEKSQRKRVAGGPVDLGFKVKGPSMRKRLKLSPA